MAEQEHRNANNAAVVHNPSKRRFEINVDGQLSVLEYTFKSNPGARTVSTGQLCEISVSDPKPKN